MKSYTDIEQSLKLAEILPLESADMLWEQHGAEPYVTIKPWTTIGKSIGCHCLSCWSLAALLDVIPYNVTFNRAVYRFKLVKFSDHWQCYHENFGTVSTEIFKADNPVDACYEMILKLKELNLL